MLAALTALVANVSAGQSSRFFRWRRGGGRRLKRTQCDAFTYALRKKTLQHTKRALQMIHVRLSRQSWHFDVLFAGLTVQLSQDSYEYLLRMTFRRYCAFFGSQEKSISFEKLRSQMRLRLTVYHPEVEKTKETTTWMVFSSSSRFLDGTL